MQEIEYRSQLPHGPESPPRQLSRRGRLHQLRDDLAALLLLRRLLQLLLLLLQLLVLLLRLARRSSGRVEPRGGPDSARAGGAVATVDGDRWGRGGVVLGIGVGFRRRGSVVVGDRRRGGHGKKIVGVRERSRSRV